MWSLRPTIAALILVVGLILFSFDVVVLDVETEEETVANKNNVSSSLVEELQSTNSALTEEISALKKQLRVKGNESAPLTAQPEVSGPFTTHQSAPLTHPQWCPSAHCHNTALCHPCHRRFLIVLTSPRSASTTLTWMLDSLPGITMSGENNDALGHMKKLQEDTFNSIIKFRAGVSQGDAGRGAWTHHKFVEQGGACVSQDMIRALNPPFLNDDGEFIMSPEEEDREIVGFKTIRFFDHLELENQEQEEELATWLKTNVPCSRFIVNVNSDVEREAESLRKASMNIKGQGRKNAASLEVRIQQRLDQMKRFAELLGEQAFFLDKIQWVMSGDMSYINDAVQWLGFDKSCNFDALLAYNTKRLANTTKGHGKRQSNLDPWPETCKAL